ncbi:MAG: hypothetical protein ACI9EZ_000801, partial [Halobacteriales archaeon]
HDAHGNFATIGDQNLVEHSIRNVAMALPYFIDTRPRVRPIDCNTN